MDKINGKVRNKRGTKQKDGGRIYIIRYHSKTGKKKIRVKEDVDTNAKFHPQDQIVIQTDDSGLITITNTTLITSIKGHIVKY